MPRTLLVGHRGFNWHPWLKDVDSDVLVADPRDANHGPPGRVTLARAGRNLEWAFVGTLDPARNPIRLLAASSQMAQRDDIHVQMFAVENSPVCRQLARALAETVSPDRILVPAGSGLHLLGWPIGPEEAEIPESLPALVLEAQRRARWLEFVESATEHAVDLNVVAVDGARLGSGDRVHLPGWTGWAEVTSHTLHLVGDEPPVEAKNLSWLDMTHTSKVSHLTPAAYEGLVCALSHSDGEDFGLGIVQRFDPVRGLLTVLSNAVAPAPVRLLRLGSLRVEPSGRELGESKPWWL